MSVPLLADGRTAPFFYILKSDFAEHAGKLGPYGWTVYNCLCFHADQSGKSFPSFATIAKECGIGKASVKRSVDALVKCGLVTLRQEPSELGWTKNIYVLTGRSATEPGVPLETDPGPDRGGARSADDQKPGPLRNRNKIHLEQDSSNKNIYRKTSCPESIEFTDSMRAFAKENGFDLEAMWEQCRDYHSFKGTQGYDWQRGFWTWLRNAKKYGEASQGNQPKVVEDDGSAWEKAAKKAGLI